MRTFVIGCNHRTAPVEIREKLAFDSRACGTALVAFREAHPDAQAVILSTCNRTELYLVRPVHARPSPQEAVEFLAHRRELHPRVLAGCVYRHEDRDAVRHLFRVAASLDSMVVGESQILGQTKDALVPARQAGTVGSCVEALFQQAFRVAKQVHTETGIGSGPVSVGSLAVDFAGRVFERFDDKVVLVVGAGKLGRLALAHLMDRRPGRVLVTSRNPEPVARLARRTGAEARPFDRLGDLLVEADIVVTSTGASRPVVTTELCADLPKRRSDRSLLMLDLAVPRDVEHAVGRLENVHLVNVDDLKETAARYRAQRRSKVEQGERIVEEHVHRFLESQARRDIAPVVADLRRYLAGIAQSELEWLWPKLERATLRDRRRIEQMLHRVVNKVLHRPAEMLNRKGREGRGRTYAGIVRKLFDLNPNGGSRPPRR